MRRLTTHNQSTNQPHSSTEIKSNLQTSLKCGKKRFAEIEANRDLLQFMERKELRLRHMNK